MAVDVVEGESHVGKLGWGSGNTEEAERASDEAARDVQKVANDSALARAYAGRGGGLTGTATRLIERLLDIGIDGKGPFKSAHEVAAKALAESHDDPKRAIKAIRRDHRQLGAAGGFATGLGGFFLLPVSLPANVLEFYLLGTRMTAAIAKVRGYDIDQPEIRSAVLLTLAGADSEDLLKKAGLLAPGGQLASVALDRLPAPALMVLNKAVGFRLLSRIGQGSIAKLGRGVPVLGGVAGGAIDVYLLGRIAGQALKEFPPLTPFGP